MWSWDGLKRGEIFERKWKETRDTTKKERKKEEERKKERNPHTNKETNRQIKKGRKIRNLENMFIWTKRTPKLREIMK